MIKLLFIYFSICFLSTLDAQINYDTLHYVKKEKYKNKKTIGLSFHTGYYKLKADVDGSGIGYGLRLNAPVNSILSLRLNIFRSTAKGLSEQPWRHFSFGGNLVENEYTVYREIPDGWFPSYKFSQSTYELEGLFNINRLINKQLDVNFEIFNLYILGSYGLLTHKVQVDLIDHNGSPYTDLLTKINWTTDKFNTKNGRKEIKESLSKIYDGKYETEIMTPERTVTFSYGAGIKFDLTPNLDLGVEYKIINYNNFDHGDGLRFRNPISRNANSDSARYLNIFFEFKF